MPRKCKECGGEIGKRRRFIPDIRKTIDLGGRRTYCLDCHPYIPRNIPKPKRPCKKCGEGIPHFTMIDGKKRWLKGRVYCISCSPFGKRLFCGRPGKSLSIEDLRNRKSRYSKRKRIELKIWAVRYLGGKCERCDYDRNYAALTFHHRDAREKEMRFGAQIMAWSRMKRELDKCEILCENCHRELHHPDYNKEKLRNVSV